MSLGIDKRLMPLSRVVRPAPAAAPQKAAELRRCQYQRYGIYRRLHTWLRRTDDGRNARSCRYTTTNAAGFEQCWLLRTFRSKQHLPLLGRCCLLVPLPEIVGVTALTGLGALSSLLAWRYYFFFSTWYQHWADIDCGISSNWTFDECVPDGIERGGSQSRYVKQCRRR